MRTRRIGKNDWRRLVYAGVKEPRRRLLPVEQPPMPIERALYEVGRPLFNALGCMLGEETLLRAWQIVALAWNSVARLDYAEAMADRYACMDQFERLGGPPEMARRLMTHLVCRKRDLFPHDQRQVERVGLLGTRLVVILAGQTAPAPAPPQQAGAQPQPAAERPRRERAPHLRLLH
ncbi:hypothetical protein [Vulgatibacter sp.]|uniref:hypothetical protein n=1 Tax=Vulgatibacter sp. TaxID=1971226 RepID=UPI00356613D1